MNNSLEMLFLVSIGYYLSLSFYHLAIYAGRRSDLSNLHYSILLLSISLLIFTKGIFPAFGGQHPVAPYLSFISVGLAGIWLMLFSNIALTDNKFTKETKRFLTFAIGISALSLIVFPFHKNQAYLIMIPVGLISPWVITLAGRMIISFFADERKLYKQNWRIWILVGTVFYAVCFIIVMPMKVFNYQEYLQAFLLNIGSFVLSSLSAFSLAARFNNDYKELIETKSKLETRIEERTKDLQQAKELIENQSIEKTAFFVNLAHETRTPATLIQNFIGKCCTRYPQDRDLAVVKTNIDKLVRDMVNFLDVEKIEQGRMSFEEGHRINLTEFLNIKSDLIIPTAEKSGIRIIRDIENDIEIVSNINAVDRILNNLLDNAIRYTTKNGTINIQLHSQEPDQILIKIEDTGIGIPQEQQQHIFDKYYQISHAKGNTQGIGMGLYITKRMVECLEGTISVRSSESGTGFCVVLPRISKEREMNIIEHGFISEEKLPIYSDNTPIENYPILENKDSVLLVEDNRDLILSTRDALADTYNVLCASNGLEAIKLLNSNKVNIIISDVMMNGMDGYELLEKLQNSKEYNDVPFIFLTAKSGIKEEIKGLTKGAIDYIQKPFEMDALKAKIQSILEYNALKKKIFELERYRSVGLLTAGICHEIMNPLTGIKGPLYLIEQNIKEMDNANDEVLLSGIDYVKKNVNRIVEIVGAMRSLFHGEAYSYEDLELNEHIRSITDILYEKIGAEILFALHCDAKVYVNTNRVALTQIIMNVLSNAIESIKGKGNINITIKDSPKRIMVKDTGQGISEKNLKRIFDIAFTTKKESGGTGLGLYIVKELCDRLNIDIKISSEVGKGSEVTLLFREISTQYIASDSAKTQETGQSAMAGSSR